MDDKTKLKAVKSFVTPTKYFVFRGTPPSVDERINHIIENGLTSGSLAESTFHIMRNGLSPNELNNFIEKIVQIEFERAQNGQPETFMRQYTIYSTALKFAIEEESKNNPHAFEDYIRDPIEYIKNFKVPTVLLPYAEKLLNQNSQATIIFSMITGPITNKYNTALLSARANNDTAAINDLEPKFKAAVVCAEKLKKLNIDSKKSEKMDMPDVKKYIQAVEQLTNSIITQPLSTQSLKTDQYSNTEKEISSTEANKDSNRTSQKISIGLHRQASQESISPKDQNEPKINPKRLARQFSREEIESEHKKQRREETQSEGVSVDKSTVEPIERKEQEQPAALSDLQELKSQVAQIREKTKALAAQIAETRQDFQAFKSQQELKTLDSDIAKLETRKEAVKALREERQTKIAQHREEKKEQPKTIGSHREGNENLPPQAQVMMRNSKIQSAKSDIEKDATQEKSSKPVSSRGSRSE